MSPSSTRAYTSIRLEYSIFTFILTLTLYDFHPHHPQRDLTSLRSFSSDPFERLAYLETSTATPQGVHLFRHRALTHLCLFTSNSTLREEPARTDLTFWSTASSPPTRSTWPAGHVTLLTRKKTLQAPAILAGSSISYRRVSSPGKRADHPVPARQIQSKQYLRPIPTSELTSPCRYGDARSLMREALA